VLFGPVTSAINARIARTVMLLVLLLVNRMADCSSSRQDVSVA